MFTGIVTAIGTIREARQLGDLRLVISCPFDPAGIAMGAWLVIGALVELAERTRAFRGNLAETWRRIHTE